MEGPSLVIAVEELKPFIKKSVIACDGTAKLPFEDIKGARLTQVRSWGKHLLLTFGSLTLRVHFLMFGSYRIDRPRVGRDPKLRLEFKDHTLYFYSCAIKVLPRSFAKDYDWSVDLMSPNWDARQALAAIRDNSEALVCDVLMDQEIFSGLGNIMKNEILFNLRLHPEARVSELTKEKQRALVREAEAYAWQFYQWKKANVLKKNWQIMRKKTCPICAGKVVKKPTGVLQRLSHFCPKCQTTHGGSADIESRRTQQLLRAHPGRKNTPTARHSAPQTTK